MVTILKKYWFGMSTEELKELNIKLELLVQERLEY